MAEDQIVQGRGSSHVGNIPDINHLQFFIYEMKVRIPGVVAGAK